MDKYSQAPQFELSDYILKRLVFVNSAGHGYSEIILDENMVLYGVNNVGKTGSLAGIKVALYPETNFFHCQKTFRFAGKEGLYRYDDSYDHYFPDARSYLVLEVENPQGLFSMVCYKTSNYGYSRFFIPEAYSEIRHLFSDVETGEINPDISTSLIAEYAKKHNGIKVSNHKELVQRMFGGHYGTPEESRYCVVPLESLNKDAIQAFRSIYQLAFESGKSTQDSLPSAIAALVEMHRDRKQEMLDANLSELVEEYQTLYAEDERLIAIKNAEPLYIEAQQSFSKAQELYRSYSIRYNALQQLFKNEYENFDRDLKAANKEAEAARSAKRTLDEAVRDKGREHHTSEVTYNTHCHRLEQDRKARDEGRRLLNAYSGKSQKEVLEIYDELIEELNAAIADYKEQDGAQKRLQKKILQRNALIKEIEVLKASIGNVERTFLHQIEREHSRYVLYTLRTELANPLVEITSEQQDVIDGFTSLFDFDGADFLTVNGVTIEGVGKREYDAERDLSERSEMLTSKNDILFDLDKEIQALKEKIAGGDVDVLIKESEDKLKETQDERILIAGIQGKEKEVSEGEIREADLKNAQELLLQEKTHLEEQQVEARADDIKKNQAWQTLSNKEQDYETIRQRLGDAGFYVTPSSLVDDALSIACKVEYADEVHALATQVKLALADVDKHYHRLDAEFRHPDIDRDRKCTEMSDFERNIQIYTNSYATLANDINRLLNEIQAHNQRIHSQLVELREANETLQREVKAINAQMNEKSISNLKDVTIRIDKKAAFDEIMHSLEKHDIHSDKFIDGDFYKRITRFASEFFDKNTGRLRLKDIIERVTYNYTKRDTGKVEDKGQSGGTTTTINTFLMSVLLSRITQTGIRLKMPIIVDEIGTLDHGNGPATIAQIIEHGFSVFCATPEYSALINKKVGRWTRIDRFHVEKPMVSGCHLKSLPKHVESIGEL